MTLNAYGFLVDGSLDVNSSYPEILRFQPNCPFKVNNIYTYCTFIHGSTRVCKSEDVELISVVGRCYDLPNNFLINRLLFSLPRLLSEVSLMGVRV